MFFVACLVLLAGAVALARPQKAMGGEAEGMVLIPAGKFIMGASERYGIVGIEIGVDSIPEREVHLEAFYMDRYEATVRQYREFLAATGRKPPLLWGPRHVDEYPPVRDNDPISDITWHDADDYCRWAGKRLPTEAEWEKAARGTDGRMFPWGDKWREDAANSDEYFRKRNRDSRGKLLHTLTEVGAMKEDVSPYGVHDMAGNVMEWTSSWYEAYPGSTLKRPLFGETFKVLRGGSWMAPAIPFSAAFNRTPMLPGEDDPFYGVRCAKDKDNE